MKDNITHQNFKILICGMPRSMTTWIFNVVSELTSDYQPKKLWIDPSDHDAEQQFSTSKGVCIAKCHHYSKALADNADFIIYSYRDIRAAAVSCHRKFNSKYSYGFIASWIDAQKAWMNYADISLQYEDLVNNEEEGLIKIIDVIRRKKPGLKLYEDSQAVRQQVEKSFQGKQTTDEVNYSIDSMILPGHRTFQPEPENLAEVDKQIYDQVQAEFSTWLRQYGYIDTDDYGQEVEFDIAAKFLSCFTEPYVIDIGVERGSFIELAVQHGAEKVDGFEPLPRHLEYLNKKYGTSDLVTINPYAVSDKTGGAQFHVALDNAGNELDYHHTLSDLGDSATVNRTAKVINVEITTLANFINNCSEPNHIDFLKIDTDGHDLNVLHGLGKIRPTIIMAEYWDDLPETSGTSEYTLRDLTEWAKQNGYCESVVVRRNGQMETVESNTSWSVKGDWGNVFFVHKDFNYTNMEVFIEELSRNSYSSKCKFIARLQSELEQKEAVIQGLSASLRQKEQVVKCLEVSQQEKEKPIQNLSKLAAEKERVIQTHESRRKRKRKLRIVADAVGLRTLASIPARIPIILRPRLGWLNQYEGRPLKQERSFLIESEQLNAYPMISIVTPSFNQANFIGKTIDSVLSQNYPNLEFFVQDGGSSDETVDVLKEYGDRLTGWESESDNGQSQAINRGLVQTSGEIMAWLNSDDLLLPDTLRIVAEYFNKHPDVDVVYGNRLMIDDEDMEIGRWILPYHSNKVLNWADFIPQETMFWRRSIWDKSGGKIDESFRFAMDWDLIMRFKKAGAKFAHIPRFLGAFRIHGAQKTSSVINDIGIQEMTRIRSRENGYEPSENTIRIKIMPFLASHIIVDLAYRIKTRMGIHVN